MNRQAHNKGDTMARAALSGYSDWKGTESGMKSGAINVRDLRLTHVDGRQKSGFGSERPKRTRQDYFLLATFSARFSFTVLAGFFLVAFF